MSTALNYIWLSAIGAKRLRATNIRTDSVNLALDPVFIGHNLRYDPHEKDPLFFALFFFLSFFSYFLYT